MNWHDMSQFRYEGRTVLADPEMIFSFPLVFSSAFNVNVLFSSSSTILCLSDFPNCSRGATQRIFIWARY